MHAKRDLEWNVLIAKFPYCMHRFIYIRYALENRKLSFAVTVDNWCCYLLTNDMQLNHFQKCVLCNSYPPSNLKPLMVIKNRLTPFHTFTFFNNQRVNNGRKKLDSLRIGCFQNGLSVFNFYFNFRIKIWHWDLAFKNYRLRPWI